MSHKTSNGTISTGYHKNTTAKLIALKGSGVIMAKIANS